MFHADDEFYVGYAPKSPPRIASRSRSAIAVALALGIAVALLTVSGQHRFDAGVFEYGVERSFDGILLRRPYPLLLVPTHDGWVTHYLVASGKHGAGELVSGFRPGSAVRVSGTAIYNEQARMIEAHQVEPLSGAEAETLRRHDRRGEQRLGTRTLVGEIVDSKCNLGAMKPGRGKPHEACAIRCISGGIPPLLRVADRAGRVEYFLLASADGGPVNQEVLDRVAEPVEITGEVVLAADALRLYADPSTYRRLDP